MSQSIKTIPALLEATEQKVFNSASFDNYLVACRNRSDIPMQRFTGKTHTEIVEMLFGAYANRFPAAFCRDRLPYRSFSKFVLATIVRYDGNHQRAINDLFSLGR